MVIPVQKVNPCVFIVIQSRSRKEMLNPRGTPYMQYSQRSSTNTWQKIEGFSAHPRGAFMKF
jgi:hypothetical protein